MPTLKIDRWSPLIKTVTERSSRPLKVVVRTSAIDDVGKSIRSSQGR